MLSENLNNFDYNGCKIIIYIRLYYIIILIEYIYVTLISHCLKHALFYLPYQRYLNT